MSSRRTSNVQIVYWAESKPRGAQAGTAGAGAAASGDDRSAKALATAHSPTAVVRRSGRLARVSTSWVTESPEF